MGGIPVLGCLPGHPAARAGVRRGDIVLQVNGRPTPTLRSYLQAKELDPHRMKIVVFRDGSESTLTIDRDGESRPDEGHVRSGKDTSDDDGDPADRVSRSIVQEVLFGLSSHSVVQA
jgi:predicted metalloprotease with PDZ domain